MTDQPRNALCACGSGRKYKHCCGRAATVAVGRIDFLRNAVFALEDRLIASMLRFAQRRFGRGWADGIADYLGLARPPQDHDETFLVHWTLFVLPVEGRRMVEWYLDDRGARLREDERTYLQAQLDSWPTLWEVQEVQPGSGVKMRDVLTGDTVFVNDHSAAESLERHGVLLARIVRVDGVVIFGGAHPQPLPPLEAQPVIEAARRLHGRRTRPVPADRLRSSDRAAALFRLWDSAVQNLYARPTPQLCNTDGEPLLFTADYFAIVPGAQPAVRAAIAGMEGADPVSDKPNEREFTISKPGNATVGAFSSTAIARLEFKAGELLVETNSLPRADRIRAAVERACGDAIRHRIRKHTDPATLLRDRGPGSPRAAKRDEQSQRDAENDIPPEVRARLLREFKQKQYATWLDEEIPALGGKTPRQAMKTPLGRERVETLIKEYESHERRLPEAERYDFDELRRWVGLEVVTR